ncbi:polysaccharide biosynthesis protein [Shewanella sediminis HAW-EB3]|uniref:Polysaccharide biosynthesis protein n=1 Tax=Shewanella sediminis (strain HAW-EB3) TaxID=425104 RepID=A8FXL7_SHESH|nr:polysaccharide biosynthesis protein [Shewanella sediminis HAW-EB3]
MPSGVLNNASWLLLEKGLLLGSGFLFTIVLTRYWSVSELGDYQYLLALVALLVPFSNLGLNSLVSRELVTRAEHTDVIMGTAVVLRLLGALLGGVIFSLLSIWLVAPTLQPLFFVLLFAQLSHAFGVFDYYFEAKVQSRVSAILRTCVGLSFMAVKLSCVVQGADLYTVLLLTVVEWVVLSLMWLLVYQLYHKRLKEMSWCSAQARRYLSRCGWLILSSIAAIVYLKIDQVMLGSLHSSESVAFYSLASRLSEVWYLVPGIVVASFYPSLIKAKEQNEDYQGSLQRLSDSLCWAAITIAILMSVIAPVLVPLLFGDTYLPVVAILQIHIWAGVFIFMRALFSKWLLIEDLPKYSLVTHGSGAIINLLLNSLLIPEHGALGAAWATLASYAVASYLGLFIFPKTRCMGVLMTYSLLAPVCRFRLRKRG